MELTGRSYNEDACSELIFILIVRSREGHRNDGASDNVLNDTWAEPRLDSHQANRRIAS